MTCPKCNNELLPGDQVHRRELHESEMPADGSEPDSWAPTEGKWTHDDCEPWPEV